jgi:CBS domain-containing protein
MPNRRMRRCSIYDGQGECCGQSLDLETRAESSPRRVPTIASRVPLRRIMTPDVVCARADLSIGAVVALMIQHHIGCIPVVDSRRKPVGMITKFDIVEQLDAFMRSVASGKPMPPDLAARTADEVMMPLAMTLDENATVAHAASMMVSEDMHHVLVINERGHLVGIVSTKDITTWIVDNDNLVPRVHSEEV